MENSIFYLKKYKTRCLQLKKNIKIITIFFILLFLFIIFLNKYIGYSSLEKVIEASWGNNVKVLDSNKEKEIVIFKIFSGNEQETYVINTYKEENGKFKYSKENEEGFIVNSPYMLRINEFEGVGNVIWGVINDRDLKDLIKEVEIKFENKKTYQNFVVKGVVKNNVFIIIPSIKFENTWFLSEDLSIETILLDNNGNVIREYKGF